MTEPPEVVRNHKDSLFRLLFREKKELLELYNALNNTAYTDEKELEIFTLENAIYMNMKNDVSFLLDSQLSLYEHQGSFCPNMPLRDLGYVARQLERYTANQSLYSSRLVKIPTPHFVVFYNGLDKQPEQRILKLSDAYERETAEPELELKVLMLNINYGCNKELLERCKTLQGYSILVHRIRTYAKEQPQEEAVDRAVQECIQEGILADILKKQRTEVMAMSLFEYNEEEELRKRDQMTLEQGREIGLRQGEEQGFRRGEEQGFRRGEEQGFRKGAKQEMQRGIRVAADIYKTMGTSFKEAVAHIAEAFSFSLPEAEQEVKKYW